MGRGMCLICNTLRALVNENGFIVFRDHGKFSESLTISGKQDIVHRYAISPGHSHQL